MKLDEFLEAREKLRQQASYVDLSELNLYRSLKLDPIAPSTHVEAPYRCHLAERYLAHLQLSQDLKPRTLVSHGVRRSLRALFTLLQGRAVGIPSDVYPVYEQLAAEAGVRIISWAAREGLPSDEALSTLDALLICEPLKPWGRSLTASDGDRLASWSRGDERRMLLIDSAYATPPSPLVLKLMHDESAVLLVSLSKGWLIPDHAGLCIVPGRFQPAAREAFAALPKDEQRLRIGYAALTEHAGRVVQVGGMLSVLAARLDSFTAGRPELAATKCVGYFATSERSFSQLLEVGVLGVPASVFGGADGTVLSSLLALSPTLSFPRGASPPSLSGRGRH